MEALENRDAYSVDDFARRHGIGRTTAYEEIKKGRLIARKLQGRTLVTVEDAKAWRESLPKITEATAA
jgi:Helix-turn-helix domain